MEINWQIVGWIAGLIFVYLFGIFEGRGQGYKKRKAEEEIEKKKEEPASYLVKVPDKSATTPVDDPGLLRIKSENGTLTLDLDGARADTSSLSPDQRRRLIEMLNLMRPWLENKPAPAVTTAPSPSPSIAPVQDKPVPAPVMPVPTPPPLQPSPAIAPGASVNNAQDKKKDDKAEATPTSMVGQINMILQARIANTVFATRGITIMETPSGGVNVFVGIDRYEGIEAVPDEEIKAVIRAAIAEWEKKFTPGLG